MSIFCAYGWQVLMALFSVSCSKDKRIQFQSKLCCHFANVRCLLNKDCFVYLKIAHQKRCKQNELYYKKYSPALNSNCLDLKNIKSLHGISKLIALRLTVGVICKRHTIFYGVWSEAKGYIKLIICKKKNYSLFFIYITLRL